MITRATRNGRGSAIAEFGPALIILFIVILFPMLDLIGLALKYADCYYLYNSLAREAGVATIIHQDITKNPPVIKSVDLTCSTDANGSMNNIINKWLQTGLGIFANTTGTPTQTATVDITEGTQTARFVHVTSTVTCNPFLKLPMPGTIPGFTSPVTFQFNGRVLVENIMDY